MCPSHVVSSFLCSVFVCLRSTITKCICGCECAVTCSPTGPCSRLCLGRRSSESWACRRACARRMSRVFRGVDTITRVTCVTRQFCLCFCIFPPQLWPCVSCFVAGFCSACFLVVCPRRACGRRRIRDAASVRRWLYTICAYFVIAHTSALWMTVAGQAATIGMLVRAKRALWFIARSWQNSAVVPNVRMPN